MSLSKNKIKYIQSLKDKKSREEHRTFVVEGDKMVSELIGFVKCQLLIATPDFVQTNQIHDNNIEEIVEVSKLELSKASFLKNPQQALGVFYQPHYILETNQLRNQLILALDCIQDPGNLGTIIRLADWYGIENIICSMDTVDVYNPKVVQATMGALARVKVHYVDLYECLRNMQEVLPLYGTFLDGKNMYQQELSETGIIVMGNEGNGISPKIETLITNKLFIPNYPPQRETSESLNVAIATAIICTEFRRRLQKQ
ncbi:RNA methyltransferase [Dysgonomonas sp. HDW5A]|uniref:RNA methyltransferase n=1 Tax=Dysgonomonas sp. HDW5A TaxID=2714926 RepID=UPI00140A387D|nr:RNA methyltransferase [Dysgonomonas sp. HDW5A]QIK61067.1 RNA methyltransferase [Dysgonomonas sp. HDW5A]